MKTARLGATSDTNALTKNKGGCLNKLHRKHSPRSGEASDRHRALVEVASLIRVHALAGELD